MAYIVAGLVLGSVYAIAACGLVLTYQCSRVFNFAQGAISFFVALTFYQFVAVWHWNRSLALLVCIVIIAPGLGLACWAIALKRLAGAPREIGIVTTIGLFIAIPALAKLLYGDQLVYQTSGLLPPSDHVFQVGDIRLTSNQACALLVAVALAVVLSLVVRRTRIGLLMRGVVDSPEMAAQSSINVGLVTAIAWSVSGLLAGLAGIIVAPVIGLDANDFTLLVVTSFAAVAIAKFESLPLAFFGAIAIGLIQETSVKYLPSTGVLANGIRPSIPFVVMLLVIFLYSNSSRASYQKDEDSLTVPLTAGVFTGSMAKRVIIVLLCIAAAILPMYLLSSFWISVVATGVTLSIVFLSYVLSMGEGAMLSLCQVSFAGLGAVVSGWLVVRGWSFGDGVVAGAAVSLLAGLLVGVISIRMGQLYFALVTLCFAVLTQQLFFNLHVFANDGLGLPLNDPSLFGFDISSPRHMYIAAVVVFAICALVIGWVRRSIIGLRLSGIRTSPAAMLSMGSRTAVPKTLVFASSALLGAIGGSLYGASLHYVDPTSFDVLTGLVWLAIVVVWGVRSTLGALIGGLMFTVVAQLISSHFGARGNEVTPLLWGLGAVAIAKEPRGSLASMQDAWTRLSSRHKGGHDSSETPIGTVSKVPVS